MPASPNAFMLFFNFQIVLGQNLLSNADKQDILKYHNIARAQVGVPALGWDTNIESATVSCLAQKQPSSMQHGICQGYQGLQAAGENLAYGVSGAKATLMFIAEKCQNAGPNSFGHWSQVVWKDTTNMACAQVQQSGMIYCEYLPKGNVAGGVAYTQPPNNGDCNGASLNEEAFKQGASAPARAPQVVPQTVPPVQPAVQVVQAAPAIQLAPVVQCSQ